jgi:molybdate transport system ATP-binding protein
MNNHISPTAKSRYRTQGESMLPILEFDAATFRFQGQPVFPDTSWTFRPDEQWAVLGANGSGKSLFVAAITGELPVSEGRTCYRMSGDQSRGAELSDECELTMAIAVVSPRIQREVLTGESSFYQSRWHRTLEEGTTTVGAFLSPDAVDEVNPFEVNPRRGPRARFKRRRGWLKSTLELADLWHRKIIQLSTGELRRVLFARALLRFPRLLILDDPFVGLDIAARRRWRQILNGLMSTETKVLVVTSRSDDILPATTHLLLIGHHRVIAQGPRRTMSHHPQVQRLRGRSAPRQLPVAPRISAPAVSSDSSGPVLVQMRQVQVRYGAKTVLAKVNWTIHQGEHWALLGPNGSGKSTLLSLIQVDNPQVYGQDISIFGVKPEPGAGLWHVRRRLGWFCPELHLHYPAECECLDVVCSGFTHTLGAYHRSSAAYKKQARQWLDRFGLGATASWPLDQLSVGEQRMVLLARALVKTPRLLLLDEPCQGLDTAHRRLVLKFIDQMVQAAGTTLVFTTHHPQEMPRCIKRTLVLRAPHS